MFNVFTIETVIDPNHWTTEAEEFRLETRVVSYEDRGTIKNVSTLCYVFDSEVSDLVAEPEVNERRVPRVSVANDVPAFAAPLADHIVFDDFEVFTKGAHGLWDAREIRRPVERDGHRSILVLSPVPDVPRVKSWTADDDGGLVRVDIFPTPRHFLVGTEEQGDVAVLFATAVERRSGAI